LHDNENNLWVGTLNGICKYIPDRNVFQRYYLVPNQSKEDLKTPKYFHIRMIQAANGNLYAFTENSIYKFDKSVNKFLLNKFQFTTIANTTRSIIEDDDHTFWLASAAGLFHVDIEKQFLDEAVISKINKDYFKTDQLYALLKNNDDEIWISTGNNGLYLFNKRSKKIIKNINQTDGLSNNFIYGILKDDDGKLWLSSNLGISIYESNFNKIRSYDINDGLQSNEFNSGAYFKTRNNELLFGGINGFNIINPKYIPFNNYKPNVNISSIRVDDFPYRIMNYQTPKNQIKFKNNQNNFEFEFTSSDYANIAKNTFEYKLDGFDKSWTKTNRRYATYPKLPHGNYTFYVRASNNDGIYSTNAASFSFRIKPMFWQTWVFRILAALFSLFYLYRLIIKFLTKARRRDKEKMKIEKQKSDFEKQLAEIKLKALVSQMNPHFIFNCMNSIQAMILSDQNMQASTYLTKLSRLVRAVLENSVKTFVPLNEVIDNLKLYLELESLRFDQQFNYDIRTENIDIYSVEMPSMLIQPYVENAIWHGLLKKVGDKNLHVKFFAKDKKVFCVIEDNGIGRVNAQTLNLKKQHKSLGTTITQEMFDTLNKIKEATYKADIIDLYDENNKATGTKVIIEMEL
jgi:sensor histidine kinase YesM